MRLAEGRLDAKRYDDAQRLAASISGPDAPAEIRRQALYLAARCAAAAGKWEQVEPAVTRPAGRRARRAGALGAEYLAAEAGYQQGQFAAAAAQLAALAQRTTDAPQSWSALAELRRAQCLAQLRKWDEALEVAQGITRRFPGFDEQGEVDYLIGRAYAAQADFTAARQAYARVVVAATAHPSQTAAMAQWMIGESYFLQEEYGRAVSEYAKVDAYPFPRWQSAALLQTAKCHERLAAWRSAVETYERLLKTFPDCDFADEAQTRLKAAREHVAVARSK